MNISIGIGIRIGMGIRINIKINISIRFSMLFLSFLFVCPSALYVFDIYIYICKK